MNFVSLLATLILLVCIIGVILYNLYVSVIKRRNDFLEAKSGIDVQFKKRYDLIPNILTVAKKFMEHETEVFSYITKLRTEAMNAESGSNEAIKLNSQIDSLVSKLMVSVENYPELKSDQTMLQAMKTYNEVEEHIAAARRFYNSALKELNNVVMIFPGSLFKSYAADVINSQYYTCDESSKQSINASQYL